MRELGKLGRPARRSLRDAGAAGEGGGPARQVLLPACVRQIVEVQLDLLRGRLRERDLELEMSNAAADALAEEGWDPQFGARPLKRVIQRQIENEIAVRLLSNTVVEGSGVHIDFDGDRFEFEVTGPECDVATEDSAREAAVK